jgi:peroxiredoxin family protein
MTTATLDPPEVTAAPTATPENVEPKPEPIQKIAIICSKGGLDMAYPGLILANAARMTGIEATLFFTFWGLDIINDKRVDHLHTPTVGNPSMPIPTMLGGLPGMESFTTKMMKKKMGELDIPPVREMLEILHDAGAEIYACHMAMEMFDLERSDLVEQVDDVLTAMDFYDKAAGAQIIFI